MFLLLKVEILYSQYQFQKNSEFPKSGNILDTNVRTYFQKASIMFRPGIKFFYAGGNMIRSIHMNCLNGCVAAQTRFLLFKGLGSFKKI
jgi:hypothetical protein